MAVGFDFGTTNTLISVILRGRAVDVTGDDGLPFPSIVRYEGERIAVGREAKEALDSAGLGIYGNTVKSPKMYLSEESIHVGGVERSPVDIVSDVVLHVKSEALHGPHAEVLDGVRHAVVTIPVNMTGPSRAALRDAFRRADIGIVQFVHEPFAALYGFIRGQRDSAGALRALNRRNVLVVDWGGGTLDLTLCRIEQRRVVQLRNGGTSDVGGDQFDQAIREEVISRFSKSAGITHDAVVHPDARLRLLQDSEANKIALSHRTTVSFYRPDFFTDPATTLNYQMTRDELDEITRPLITSGLRQIDALLNSVSLGPSQVAMCLVVGGMAAMPAIRGRLHELFGPQRVEIPKDSATLVARGAAWIAFDATRLQLAKPIELQLARGSFLPIIKAGADMPAEGEDKSQTVHLYCTDPTDGIAKFELVAPTSLSKSTQISDPRSPLAMLTVRVHDRAKLFQERLELDLVIDDDLILNARAWSSMARDEDTTAVHDLEFGLPLPGRGEEEEQEDDVDAESELQSPTEVEVNSHKGDLAVRANVANEPHAALVPGEVLYRYKKDAFRRNWPALPRATEEQIDEHLYYKPCGACGRDVNDPECRCATVPPSRR